MTVWWCERVLASSLCLSGDVDRRARQADLLGRREQLGAAGRVAEGVAEVEVVDQRRALLHLAVDADDRRLAVRLDLLAEQIDAGRSDQLPDRLGDLVGEGDQVLDVLGRERVLDDDPDERDTVDRGNDLAVLRARSPRRVAPSSVPQWSSFRPSSCFGSFIEPVVQILARRAYAVKCRDEIGASRTEKDPAAHEGRPGPETLGDEEVRPACRRGASDRCR